MKTKIEEMEGRLTLEPEKAKTRQEIEDSFKKKMEKFKKDCKFHIVIS